MPITKFYSLQSKPTKYAEIHTSLSMVELCTTEVKNNKGFVLLAQHKKIHRREEFMIPEHVFFIMKLHTDL